MDTQMQIAIQIRLNNPDKLRMVYPEKWVTVKTDSGTEAFAQNVLREWLEENRHIDSTAWRVRITYQNMLYPE